MCISSPNHAIVLRGLPCSIRAKFEKVIRDAQDSICAAISEIDGKPFHQDAWTRQDGGGGITRVLVSLAWPLFEYVTALLCCSLCENVSCQSVHATS